jgi:hypothetical protein
MAEPLLNYQWVTEHPLDAEHKRYVLLAYVQNIKKKFSGELLFPHLSDIISHLRNLEEISSGFQSLDSNFPKEISGFDPQNLSPVFKRKNSEENVASFIHDLISFAHPHLSNTAAMGKEIFDEVEHNLSMETIGLMPVLKDEGYLLLNVCGTSEINIYRYAVSSITLALENYRSMSMQWVLTDSLSLGNSLQNIKLNLIKKFPDLPNPATFVFTSLKAWPIKETLLPVTRRKLLRTLSENSSLQS